MSKSTIEKVSEELGHLASGRGYDPKDLDVTFLLVEGLEAMRDLFAVDVEDSNVPGEMEGFSQWMDLLLSAHRRQDVKYMQLDAFRNDLVKLAEQAIMKASEAATVAPDQCAPLMAMHQVLSMTLANLSGIMRPNDEAIKEEEAH